MSLIPALTGKTKQSQQFKASLSHMRLSQRTTNKQIKSNYLKESSTVSMINTNKPLV